LKIYRYFYFISKSLTTSYFFTDFHNPNFTKITQMPYPFFLLFRTPVQLPIPTPSHPSFFPMAMAPGGGCLSLCAPSSQASAVPVRPEFLFVASSSAISSPVRHRRPILRRPRVLRRPPTVAVPSHSGRRLLAPEVPSGRSLPAVNIPRDGYFIGNVSPARMDFQFPRLCPRAAPAPGDRARQGRGPGLAEPRVPHRRLLRLPLDPVRRAGLVRAP
jgi:hypothetical protein